MPPRERERERSWRRRGPRGGNPDRPSQLSRRERGLPTEDRGRETERDAHHRERGVDYRRVERGRGRDRASRDSRDWKRSGRGRGRVERERTRGSGPLAAPAQVSTSARG